MTLTTLIGGRRESRDLVDGTYVIGRGESCRVRIDLPDVSERHAILTVRGDRAIIEDLHSSNGTLVNGELVDQVQINSSFYQAVGTIYSVGVVTDNASVSQALYAAIASNNLEAVQQIIKTGQAAPAPAADMRGSSP